MLVERQEALGIQKVENENRKGPDSDPPHRCEGWFPISSLIDDHARTSRDCDPSCGNSFPS